MSKTPGTVTYGALFILCSFFSRPVPGYSQTPAPPALSPAQQAYQELEGKNYGLAVDLFLKALEADPGNSPLRKDLAYAYVRQGSLLSAADQFEIVYRTHPEDLATALELGFLYNQMNRDALSAKYFKAAAQSLDPEVSKSAREALNTLRDGTIQARKEQGYELLRQNRRSEAIAVFEEVRQQDPHDYSTVMQLGYLYDEEGQKKNAERMFRAAADSANPQVAEQARTALRTTQGMRGWWFGSLYFAPFYTSRFGNEINSLDAKVGLQPSRYFQPYIGLRLTRDTRSQTGRLPVIFSDNTAVLSLGVQSRPFGPAAVVYAEAGTAFSLLDNPQHGRAIPDYRTGISWFKPWGSGLAEAVRETSRRTALFGEAYSDLAYYSRYGQNVIGYLQIKEGLTLSRKHVLPMQVFAAVNLIKDSQSDFYNNVAELGPGLRLAPLKRLPMVQIQAQYLRGYYMTQGHRTRNPYGPNYNDYRLFLIWEKDF